MVTPPGATGLMSRLRYVCRSDRCAIGPYGHNVTDKKSTMPPRNVPVHNSSNGLQIGHLGCSCDDVTRESVCVRHEYAMDTHIRVHRHIRAKSNNAPAMQGVGQRDVVSAAFQDLLTVTILSFDLHSSHNLPLVGFESVDSQSTVGQREQSLRQCHVSEPNCRRYSGISSLIWLQN